MNPFNRLPASRRSPSGLEWPLLKKLPAVLLTGTLLCAGFALLLQSGWLGLDEKETQTAQYATIGLMLFHWMSVLMLGLGCVIVVVMKGHAYVMDAYVLPDSESPQHPKPQRHRRKVR
jgi:hypothetical protein